MVRDDGTDLVLLRKQNSLQEMPRVFESRSKFSPTSRKLSARNTAVPTRDVSLDRCLSKGFSFEGTPVQQTHELSLASAHIILFKSFCVSTFSLLCRS